MLGGLCTDNLLHGKKAFSRFFWSCLVVLISAAGVELFCQVTGKKENLVITCPAPQVPAASEKGKVSEQFIMELDKPSVAN